MVIPSSSRVAYDVIESREISLESCLVSAIVKDFNVCSPSLADSMHSPLLTSSSVDAVDDIQYGCIVMVELTVNPVLDKE